MIRIVLVGWALGDWRIYRQPQWMAEVRRAPEATNLPRHHFDIDEAAYARLQVAWRTPKTPFDEAEALRTLNHFGAIALTRS